MSTHQVQPSGITLPGILVGLACLAIAGSVLKDLRLTVGGAAVHPFLLVLLPLVVITATKRLGVFPSRVLLAMTAFTFLYLTSMLQGVFSVSEALKVFAALGTVVLVAISLRNPIEVRIAVAMLALGVAVMSMRGLLGPAMGPMGINPLEEIANKNAFSLYALPAILLALWWGVKPDVPRWQRGFLLVTAATTVLAVFATANRSGWVGAVMIVPMLLYARGSVRAAIGVSLVGMVVWWVGSNLGLLDVVEFRINQTSGAYASDDTRRELVWEAFRIGLDHPFLGIGPQELPYELARRLRFDSPAVDPHNVFGHLFGGSGAFGLLSLLVVGTALWRLPLTGSRESRDSRLLIRCMLILWAMRGLFTREILYSAGFTLGLGLVVANYLVTARDTRGGAARYWASRQAISHGGPRPQTAVIAPAISHPLLGARR